MTLTGTRGFLPNLANKNGCKDERLDSHWLWDLHQLRLLIYRAMLHLGADEGRQIAAVTDQLVGCKLLLKFIRDQQITAAPALAEYVSSCKRQTVRDLGRHIQTQCMSPLVAAVFDASALNDTLPILDSGDIDWAMPRSLPPKCLELCDFGNFHQFCLSNPLAEHANGFSANKATHTRRKRGIHYTPASLVDYLTCRTLDPVMKHKQFPDLLKTHLLDPSCGCGAFLIAAVRYLFALYQKSENPVLCAQQRLDLLGNVVHGIDIDPLAVEWTRRVLLLAVWEASIGEDSVASLRIPNLRKNIVCGDFLSMEGAPVDAIIGGPPFVRLQTLQKTDRFLIRKYRANYRTARHGQFDLYMLFFEQAIRRLRPGGWLGWSVSNSFLRSSSGRTVRCLISSNGTIHELVEFESRKVYPDAVIQIALVLFAKDSNAVSCRHAWIKGDLGHRQKLASLLDNKPSVDTMVRVCNLPKDACRGSKWAMNSADRKKTLGLIKEVGFSLKLLPISFSQGIVTGADSVFLVRSIRNNQDGTTLVRNRVGEIHQLESAALRPIVRNRDIRGFARPSPKTLCIVPYDASGKLLTEQSFRNIFPRTYGYLQRYREQLGPRSSRTSLSWFAFQSSASLYLPSRPRILLKKICSGGDFTFDIDDGFLCHSSVLILVPMSKRLNPYFLLGILNSSVFWTFVHSTMPTMGEGRHSLRTCEMKKFPLLVPSLKPLDTRQDRIQKAVAQLHADRIAAADRKDIRVPLFIQRHLRVVFGYFPSCLSAILWRARVNSTKSPGK